VVFVEVIENENVALRLMTAMQPAGVLHQSALEGERHRQHEGVQLGEIEALANQ